MTRLIVRSLLLLVIVLEIIAAKKLVGYWGDNSSKGEKDLKYYCDLNVYNTIIISQLTKNDRGTNKGIGTKMFQDNQFIIRLRTSRIFIFLFLLITNIITIFTDGLPTLSFANHCNYNPLLQKDPNYNLYKRCPKIEADIKHCQNKGVY